MPASFKKHPGADRELNDGIDRLRRISRAMKEHCQEAARREWRSLNSSRVDTAEEALNESGAKTREAFALIEEAIGKSTKEGGFQRLGSTIRRSGDLIGLFGSGTSEPCEAQTSSWLPENPCC